MSYIRGGSPEYARSGSRRSRLPKCRLSKTDPRTRCCGLSKLGRCLLMLLLLSPKSARLAAETLLPKPGGLPECGTETGSFSKNRARICRCPGLPERRCGGASEYSLLLPKRRRLLLLWGRGSSSLAKRWGLSKNARRRRLPESSPEEASCPSLLGLVGSARLPENWLEKTGLDGAAGGLKRAPL